MSSKAIVLVFIFFIFLILPIQAQKVEIKKENGVTVVLNPKKPVKLPGMPTTLKLTEDLCLGKETNGDSLPPDIKLEWPENYPPLYYFALDDRGWMYVSTYEKDIKGNIYFDVFDAEGRCFARFSHPEGETLFVVKKNKAYFLIQESEEGLPLVKRYSMDWK
jgi:hypothetical protein